jgi:hypothetical protein
MLADLFQPLLKSCWPLHEQAWLWGLVLAVARPGYGESTKPGSGLSWMRTLFQGAFVAFEKAAVGRSNGGLDTLP